MITHFCQRFLRVHYSSTLSANPYNPYLLVNPCWLCALICVWLHVYMFYRVASVQSEPGQQNLLIQPALGRKRGLRQVSWIRTACYTQKLFCLDVRAPLLIPIYLWMCSCVAPCCPYRRCPQSLVVAVEQDFPPHAGVSNQRTDHWVTLCVCLFVKEHDG